MIIFYAVFVPEGGRLIDDPKTRRGRKSIRPGRWIYIENPDISGRLAFSNALRGISIVIRESKGIPLKQHISSLAVIDRPARTGPKNAE